MSYVNETYIRVSENNCKKLRNLHDLINLAHRTEGTTQICKPVTYSYRVLKEKKSKKKRKKLRNYGCN